MALPRREQDHRRCAERAQTAPLRERHRLPTRVPLAERRGGRLRKACDNGDNNASEQVAHTALRLVRTATTHGSGSGDGLGAPARHSARVRTVLHVRRHSVGVRKRMGAVPFRRLRQVPAVRAQPRDA